MVKWWAATLAHKLTHIVNISDLVIHRSLGYERVYLPLCKVADTPYHIQGDDMCTATGDKVSGSDMVFKEAGMMQFYLEIRHDEATGIRHI